MDMEHPSASNASPDRGQPADASSQDSQPQQPGTPEQAGTPEPANTHDQVWGGAAGEDAPGGMSEVATLRAELDESRKRVLQAHAELENFRKRMRREADEDRKYAALPLMTDLLGVVDNLERAIEAAEQNEGAAGLLQGVKLVSDQLRTVLTQHHCEPIVAEGQPFDPNYHEALAQQPNADVPPGTVLQVVRSGYRLRDRMVRPAQVLVSSQPQE